MSKLQAPLIKLISSASLVGSLAVSSFAFAEAPGGPGCGWGSAMFEGGNTKFDHVGGAIFNSISSNQALGLMSNTNGCKADGTITYDGKVWDALHSSIDSLAEDIALGEGETLEALSVVMKIKKTDQIAFNKLLQNNFNIIFPSENIHSNDVIASIQKVMKQDTHFSQYLS